MSDLLSMNQPNSPRRYHKNEQFNRHSTGSLLSWDTATDHNNNDARFSDEVSDTYSPQKCHEYRHSYHDGLFKKDVSDDEENHLKSSGYFTGPKGGNSRDSRDWIVQNMDGITRFDVVFSSPKNMHEKPERDTPSRGKFISLLVDASNFSMFEQLYLPNWHPHSDQMRCFELVEDMSFC